MRDKSTPIEEVEELDQRILEQMLRLAREGRGGVRAGELARLTHTDSVRALGAALRVRSRFLRKLAEERAG